jgi:UDP-glucuronate 4-epimerase
VQPKRVLVSGAAGFIGSSAVDALLDRGDHVVGLDNFDAYYEPARKRANLHGAMAHADRFELVEGDVRDEALIQRLFTAQRFDAVLHLAGLAGVRASIGNARSYFEVNVQGSIHLLDASRAARVENFVFASSSSVYGSSPSEQFFESDACDRPLAPYPASKRSVELLGHTYHHLHGLSFTGLRFFTVYGPRCRPDLMAFKLLTSIGEGQPVELYDDGELRRDFTYIDDVTAAILLAIDRPLGYELINIARGVPVQLSDFVRMLEEISAARARLVSACRPAADASYTGASIDKARSLLGFEPRTDLREGLQRLWAWYSELRA